MNSYLNQLFNLQNKVVAITGASGHLCSEMAQGFSKLLFGQVNTFLGVTWQNLRGAANRNSPLFKKKDNFSAAIGFVWWF